MREENGQDLQEATRERQWSDAERLEGRGDRVMRSSWESVEK